MPDMNDFLTESQREEMNNLGIDPVTYILFHFKGELLSPEPAIA
jgi:hypothetical protein